MVRLWVMVGEILQGDGIVVVVVSEHGEGEGRMDRLEAVRRAGSIKESTEHER